MGDFDRKQLEQLNAIGEYLQHIRQDQGRSLDDISAKTYIPLRILRGLEGGQASVLPEAVFVQGFIRRYADALGLDGISLCQNFPVQRETVSFDSSERERTESAQTLTEARPSERVRPNSSAKRTAASRRRQTPLPLLIGGLLVAGGLVYGLSRLLFAPQRPASTATSAPTTSAPVSPTAAPAAPAATVSPTATPAASPSPAALPASPPATSAPVSVAMNVTADSWVQVITDGRVIYEGTLKKGTQRNWSARKEMTIVSGNAGGVSLSYNQRAAKPMGAPGTVQEATFTADASSSPGNSAAPN